MLHTIKIPRLNANEDSLTIVDINEPLGSHVKAGQIIFVVESAKATVEVPASVDGYIKKINVEVGQVLEVGETVVVLSDTPDEELVEDNQPNMQKIEKVASGLPKHLTAKQRLMATRDRKKIPEYKVPVSNFQQNQSESVGSDEIPWVKKMRETLEGRCPMLVNVAEKIITGPLSGPYEAKGVYIEKGAVIDQGVRICAKRIVLRVNSKVGSNTFLR